MRVDFELTTCGCTRGGIGSVRVYRGGREVRKEIIASLSDAAQIVKFCPGERYLIKIRTRLPEGEFLEFVRWLRSLGTKISIKEDGWGIRDKLSVESQ